MQTGKDVYVEKPVSHNVWEGRRIVEAARHYKKICQTGTQSRSTKGLRDAIGAFYARRQHRVQVRRQGHVRRRALGGNDVARAIDGGLPAGRAHLFQKPGCALLFQECGRWHAAKLQVGLIDPLLFAREPLQPFPHRALLRQFADVHPRRCRVGRHGPVCQCSSAESVRSPPILEPPTM